MIDRISLALGILLEVVLGAALASDIHRGRGNWIYIALFMTAIGLLSWTSCAAIIRRKRYLSERCAMVSATLGGLITGTSCTSEVIERIRNTFADSSPARSRTNIQSIDEAYSVEIDLSEVRVVLYGSKDQVKRWSVVPL